MNRKEDGGGRDPLVPITGLWARLDRNNNTYFSGSSGGVRWLVLPVIGANGDPDYRLYVSSGNLHKDKGGEEEQVYEEDPVAVG